MYLSIHSKQYITLLLFMGSIFLPASYAINECHEKKANAMLEKKGEVYFMFQKPETGLYQLSNRISIDKILDRNVYAYANEASFSYFIGLNIPFEVLDHPGDVDFDLNMKTWEDLLMRDLTESWDFYPTYEAYVSLMYYFEDTFPDLAEIVKIGESVLGRDLLFAKISPQVNERRPVPQFMYTSTMHGDETAGFILSLRLIHHLLTNYGEDDAITDLMNNVEIWICPNENPDGTYRFNNSTLAGATRGNINGVDLNRNYPNPVNDPLQVQQPETTAMINFTDTMNFIMSANMHGGIELVNFPFDSWTSNQNKHADHDWWEFVMYEYVDTVHAHSPAGYMTGMGDGVTHGGDWYVIYGSRQDYFNYYKSCREFTLELSNQKLLNPALLPAHWDYNYRSLLNYIRQSTYGLHGTVYDNETGEPLLAEIYIPGHDSDNSQVYTALPHGNYNRPILEGTYDIRYSAEIHNTVTITGVDLFNYHTKNIHIALGAESSGEIFEISLSIEGEGGKVLPYSGTGYFNDGANVFLNAIPDSGYQFLKWTENGEIVMDDDEPAGEAYVFTAEADRNLVAVFQSEETDIPVHVEISDQVVTDGEDVCFSALLTITISNFTVEAGGSTRLIAGENIRLLSGTSVAAGGYLQARIAADANDYCDIPEAKEIASVVPVDSKEDIVSTDLSIEIRENGFFKIYPNPTDGMFTLELTTIKPDQNTTVEIYSMVGDRLFSEELHPQRSYELSLEHYQPGMYIIRVIKGDQVGMERVIRR